MKSPVALAAALLSLAACAYHPPLSPARYETAGAGDLWSDGMRLHPVPSRPLAFTSGFHDAALRSTGDGEVFGTPFTFLVMAENRSSQPVTLDPLAFRADLPLERRTLAPVDPEEAIRMSHAEIVSERGAMDYAQGVDALTQLPLLALDAAAPGKTPEQVKKERQAREEERRTAEERDARHRERMRLAAARRDQWSERALRKTTILPGMRALGTVSFRGDAAAPRPDSLVLRYRGGDGLWVDLGRFGRVRDSVEDARHAAAKSRRTASATRDSAHGRYFPKPGREPDH